MLRTQTTNGSSTSPKDFSFYFGGVKIGTTGNNGADNFDYHHLQLRRHRSCEAGLVVLI